MDLITHGITDLELELGRGAGQPNPLSIQARADLHWLARLPFGGAAEIIRRKVDPLYRLDDVAPADMAEFREWVREYDEDAGTDLSEELDLFRPDGRLINFLWRARRGAHNSADMLHRATERMRDSLGGVRSIGDDDDDD